VLGFAREQRAQLIDPLVDEKPWEWPTVQARGPQCRHAGPHRPENAARFRKLPPYRQRPRNLTQKAFREEQRPPHASLGFHGSALLEIERRCAHALLGADSFHFDARESAFESLSALLPDSPHLSLWVDMQDLNYGRCRSGRQKRCETRAKKKKFAIHCHPRSSRLKCHGMGDPWRSDSGHSA
jgi:hypothetical protein